MRTRYFTVCHMIIYVLFEGLFLPNKKQSQYKLKLCNPTTHKINILLKVLIYERVLDFSKVLKIQRPRDGFT